LFGFAPKLVVQVSLQVLGFFELAVAAVFWGQSGMCRELPLYFDYLVLIRVDALADFIESRFIHVLKLMS
jgi:hypothetical protein